MVAAIVLMPALTRADEREPHPLYGLPPPPHEKHANAVQADLGLGVVGLAYERVLSPSVAIQIEANVFGTWWGPTFDLPHFRGAGGQVRPTFFVSGDAPRGVYVAPYVRGAAVSSTRDGHTGHGFGWSAGTFVGYSWMFGDSVNLRIGGGAQYMHYAVDAGPHRIEWKRLYPALDLVVGYTF
jgi:hypothetical protein